MGDNDKTVAVTASSLDLATGQGNKLSYTRRTRESAAETHPASTQNEEEPRNRGKTSWTLLR